MKATKECELVEIGQRGRRQKKEETQSLGRSSAKVSKLGVRAEEKTTTARRTPSPALGGERGHTLRQRKKEGKQGEGGVSGGKSKGVTWSGSQVQGGGTRGASAGVGWSTALGCRCAGNSQGRAVSATGGTGGTAARSCWSDGWDSSFTTWWPPRGIKNDFGIRGFHDAISVRPLLTRRPADILLNRTWSMSDGRSKTGRRISYARWVHAL